MNKLFNRYLYKPWFKTKWVIGESGILSYTCKLRELYMKIYEIALSCVKD